MALPLAEIRHGKLRYVGASSGGEETFIVAPELNLAFDVGRAQRELIGIDHVFLSHGHMDHAAGAAYYFSQRKFIDNPPGNLYVPDGLEGPLRRLMEIWGEIDGQVPPGTIHVARPGEDIRLRRDLLVRPFLVNHPCRRRDRPLVCALGYAAIEVRNKLKDEFLDLTGPQIVELKNKGVEITRRQELPLAAYCGDTAPGEFIEHQFVRDAQVLFLECTFVEPDHRERARAGSHLHVTDLPAMLPKLDNERIVLIHLSRRTLVADALRILQATLGDEMEKRVTLLMDLRRNGQRRRRRGRPAPTDGAPDARRLDE